MKTFAQKNRLMIALFATMLWFAGLNLCAFGVFAGTAGKSTGCPFCHGKQTAGKTAPAASLCDKYNSQQTAASPSHHQIVALTASALPVLAFFSLAEIRVIAPRLETVPATTSPPGRRDFAELVLQTSLLTQAPPRC